MKRIYNKYKPHYKENLTLAIPVVISQLGHTLVHTADSIIVGQFAGTIPLAAVSLVNSIFMIIMVLGIGISYGLTPLVAQENGKNNFEECGKLLSNSLIINIFTGIALFCFIYFGSVLFIDHLDQSPEVVYHAKPYLNLLGLSVIPLMVFLTFKQFAEGLGFTKQAMMISIWGNVINIILGIIFVKGLFGISPMGVKGVGYSTLIDRSIMAIVMVIYVFKSVHFRKYLKNFVWNFIDKIRLKRIFKQGAPTAMQYTFEVSAFSGAAILIGTIGAVEQAAHQVAINLAATTYMMASGISAAATIKTGNNFGKSDFQYLRLSAISSYHIVLIFMSITAALFMGLNNILPAFYSKDTAVIEIAAGLLLIAAIFQLFDGAQVVGLGILRGMGDVNLPTLITFMAYWVFGLPVGYYLGITLNFGVSGIWIGLTLGLLVASILLFLRFQKLSKKLI
ncbi:multidrug resistance protein NorM [Pedobacter glucosidilyticus]|uniref:Multidrug-efflux transporter n=1 Tax=Pedobacter aquae TaxID=2605747 RepID=A0A5C0VE84_9SPHI|nr:MULTISPECIES: MATE family efflux transporter [Pedobacter]KHJ37418.1 multidrug resistance protein NorM [Pedobacter glucosidilyticus]QEK50985.1 MATE family efflux transporter [Pedobacter aquae]